MDTIFALSSGSPPAAIAIVRVSGQGVRDALVRVAGKVPEPRRADYAVFRGGEGEELDRGLVLFFPGPNSVTGEDLAEFHLHGGKAVIAAVQRTLSRIPGLRPAEPGEFTRRAFANGRIDLAEAEGLADLLSAETELQRRAAITVAGGALSAQVARWREAVLVLSAQVEGVLDFSDEEDSGDLPETFFTSAEKLANELRTWLDRPRTERLREGFRVLLAGPPNSGKSTLFNALLEIEAAITSKIAGTTRDVLERPVAMAGIPFVLVDTAGLRDAGVGEIERIGIARARAEADRADVVLWLGEEGQGPRGAWEIASMADRTDVPVKANPVVKLSAVTGVGIEQLRHRLVAAARETMPNPGETAINARQAELLGRAFQSIGGVQFGDDLLIIGERLRGARGAFDRLIGRTSTEDMLDTLFGRFCIGK